MLRLLRSHVPLLPVCVCGITRLDEHRNGQCIVAADAHGHAC